MAKAITRISDLIIKHLKEELTVEEDHELQGWAHSSPETLDLFHQLTGASSLKEAMQEAHELRACIRAKIDKRMKEYDLEDTMADRLYLPVARPSRKRVWLYAAAACILVAFTSGYFWLTHLSHSAPAEHTALLSKNDVAPGSDKAVLTLGNGATIVLENAVNGNLALQGNSRVSKDKNLLAYSASKNTSSGNTSSGNASSGTSTPSSVVYNTLTTPRAGQFRLILPDGSKVWLNNASSLRYPTSFTGKKREVALSGEAYFEIAKDAAKPFTVKLADLAVDVLGTSFNIMAYGDEKSIRTTLLEGKVKLKQGHQEIILTPGEQASTSGAEWKVIKDVDTDEAVSWKNGFFNFYHANLPTVLRQLARWYDVDVEYQGTIPPQIYQGGIDRDQPLAQVLENLQSKEVHFRIDGKKLIVSK